MRVQGGTSGLIAALVFGRVDPFNGEDVDQGPRWRSKRRNWYARARAERESSQYHVRAERREMGREVLSIPDLLGNDPF